MRQTPLTHGSDRQVASIAFANLSVGPRKSRKGSKFTSSSLLIGLGLPDEAPQFSQWPAEAPHQRFYLDAETIQGKRAVKELAQGEVPPLVLKKSTFLRFRDPNHYLK